MFRFRLLCIIAFLVVFAPAQIITKRSTSYSTDLSDSAGLVRGAAGLTTNNKLLEVSTSDGVIQEISNQEANRIYAGPASGAASAPGFRALISADVPTIRGQDSVVLLGDSVTEPNGIGDVSAHTGDTGFFVWANYILGMPFQNVHHAGVSGSTSTTLLTRWASDVTAYNPRLLFFQVGINDIAADATAQTIIQNLSQMYGNALSSDITVVAFTIGPSATIMNTAGRRTIYDTVNSFIRSFVAANSRSMVLVDAAVLLGGNGASYIAKDDVLWDDIHLSSYGAVLLGQEIADQLTASAIILPPAYAMGQGAYIATPLANSNMVGTGGGTWENATGDVAASWGVDAYTGTSAVCSKVARTDGLAGEWQQMVLTGAGEEAIMSQSASISPLAVGDQVVATAEVNPVGSWAGVVSFQMSVSFTGSSVTYFAHIHNGDYGVNLQTNPGPGLLQTLPFQIPTGASAIAVNFKFTLGSGSPTATVQVGRVELRKSFYIPGAISAGPGGTVSAWKKYSVVKIADNTYDCDTAKGCWRVNLGASVPATAATSQAITWLAAPINAVLEQARWKTTTACAGLTAITLTDMGTTSSASEFVTGGTYNLKTAAGATNLLWPVLLTPGLTTAATAWTVTISGGVENIDDITNGCAFDIHAKWGALP